ncbi:hypothetical protein V2J09_014597 [Rumex salicifolius]
MASVSLSSTLPSPSSSLHRKFTARILSSQANAFAPTRGRQLHRDRRLSVAQTFDFSSTFFEGGFAGEEEDEDSNSPPGSGGLAVAVEEERPEIQCPPGLRKYETMAVLRPDMTENERLTLTQKYEELLVAGGGMYVEVFNRGVIPLAYSIKKKNKAGETNTYLDGIYLLFTYFTKAESMGILDDTLKTDDDVIRSTSVKIRKRKY